MNPVVKNIQDLIIQATALGFASREEVQQLSDGVHSFDDLYKARAHYNALAFALLNYSGFNVCKAKYHHDGTQIPGMFVVGFWPSDEWPESLTSLVQQFTQHYPLDFWDLFKIPEYKCLPFAFDGHDKKDTLERIGMLITLIDHSSL